MNAALQVSSSLCLIPSLEYKKEKHVVMMKKGNIRKTSLDAGRGGEV